MWFDARAKLAEIAGHPPATSATAATAATAATQAPAARPVSQLSQVSQPPEPGNPTFRVANVASVATPPHREPEPAPGARPTPDAGGFPYGTACNLGEGPRTWTGQIVSLAKWRALSDWEKHGPNGRHWCGITRTWICP